MRHVDIQIVIIFPLFLSHLWFWAPTCGQVLPAQPQTMLIRRIDTHLYNTYYYNIFDFISNYHFFNESKNTTHLVHFPSVFCLITLSQIPLEWKCLLKHSLYLPQVQVDCTQLYYTFSYTRLHFHIFSYHWTRKPEAYSFLLCLCFLGIEFPGPLFHLTPTPAEILIGHTYEGVH